MNKFFAISYNISIYIKLELSMCIYFQTEDKYNTHLINLSGGPDSENLAGTWEELAKDLNNRTDQPIIAHVDCNEERALCSKGYYVFIKSNPTIFMYQPKLNL